MAETTIREYRLSRRENQKRFWGRFGISQSRGSRLEQGQSMPTPVQILVRLFLDGVVSEGDLRRARQRNTLAKQDAATMDGHGATEATHREPTTFTG